MCVGQLVRASEFEPVVSPCVGSHGAPAEYGTGTCEIRENADGTHEIRGIEFHPPHHIIGLTVRLLIVPTILVPIGLGWITNLVEFATAVVSIVVAGMFTTLTVLQLVSYVVYSNQNIN